MKVLIVPDAASRAAGPVADMLAAEARPAACRPRMIGYRLEIRPDGEEPNLA